MRARAPCWPRDATLVCNLSAYETSKREITDREAAKDLIAEYLRFGDVFNRVVEISDRIPDKTQRSIVRGSVAEAQFHFYEIVRAVGKEYPDLIPDVS